MTSSTMNTIERVQEKLIADEQLSSSDGVDNATGITAAGTISPLQLTPTKNPPQILVSPSKRVISDRFIPFRDNNNWQNKIALSFQSKALFKKRDGLSATGRTYKKILKNEILGTENEEAEKSSSEPSNIFQYMSPTKENASSDNASAAIFSLSPVSQQSHKILRTQKKSFRKISHIPCKVLDAPELQDDFYLNLLDWSSQNLLAVGLGTCVYLWSGTNSKVTRLCELEANGNMVTSVCWNTKGNLIAVGNAYGYTHIWDATTLKKVNVLPGHSSRIGSLAWKEDLLASGSRDRLILVRDMRAPSDYGEIQYTGHRQEVCGLKWSPDGRYLASGGNDNRVNVWGLSNNTPVQTYTSHTAAVKADRYIRFWNTLTGQPVQAIDTGSQVCNLVWSKNSTELVSTHGYTQNQIYIWNYPNLNQIAKLMGHSLRVLYLAMSPNGETIVTGAGDETLRFWNVFNKPPHEMVSTFLVM
ncbi:Fizzy-related protein [Blattella germanica]|nr:Fizzy-related protein [Blattella germanica]